MTSREEGDPETHGLSLEDYKKTLLDTVKTAFADELRAVKDELASVQRKTAEETRLVSTSTVKKLQAEANVDFKFKGNEQQFNMLMSKSLVWKIGLATEEYTQCFIMFVVSRRLRNRRQIPLRPQERGRSRRRGTVTDCGTSRQR